MFFEILRGADIFWGLPRLGDEQATLRFGVDRFLTLMDGILVETQVVERQFEFLVVSSTKVKKMMRNSARPHCRTAEFFTVL
jgi:hypothetical protein